MLVGHEVPWVRAVACKSTIALTSYAECFSRQAPCTSIVI